MSSLFPAEAKTAGAVSFFPTFPTEETTDQTTAGRDVDTETSFPTFQTAETTTHLPSFPIQSETPALSQNANLSPIEEMRANISSYKPKIAFYKSQLPLEVKTQDEANLATRIAGTVKSEVKLIEVARKNITAPMNEVIKKINGLCKEVTDPFTEIENTAKKRLSSYHAEQEMQRQKDAELERVRAKEEQERLNAKAEVLGVEAPIVPEILAPEKTNSTRTEHGTSYTRKTWNFTIQNASEIPLEYLIVDEKKIKEAIKVGIRHIPGINIFEQSSIAIRS